jgi:mono/diheme cytochrome c family protein
MRYCLRKQLVTYHLSLITILSIGFVSCGGNEPTSNQNNPPAAVAVTDNSPYADGKKVYQKTCISCHQADGKGMQGVYPPLSKSDYLLADKFRAIRQVIKGSSGKIKVNDTIYQGVMTPQALNDSDIARVLNYVYHSFGNNGFTVAPADVKSVRDTIK